MKTLHIPFEDKEYTLLEKLKDKSKEDFEGDRQLILSLIKEVEIIGEAANKISSDFRSEHSQIPWYIIVRTRNRLIHGYFDIDTNIVWRTITEELPPLIDELEKIIV